MNAAARAPRRRRGTSRCQLCGKDTARVTETARVPRRFAERLILSLAALAGVRVEVHLVRLVECTGCNPGRVTRHRELVLPIEAEYSKGYVRAGR